jgi:hypothetical protein
MQVGFICPDGERVLHADCLEKPCRMASKHPIGRCKALPLLRRLAHVRQWNGKPSTTQCINGTMEAFLKVTRDYYIDPEAAIFRTMGTLTHGLLEQYATGSNELSEVKLDDMLTTGILDHFDGNDMILLDYKNSGSFKVAAALGLRQVEVPTLDAKGQQAIYKTGPRKGQPKTHKEWHEGGITGLAVFDWSLQMSHYRDLLTPKLPNGWSVRKMAIQIITRDGGTSAARSRGVNLINGMSTHWVNRYFARKAQDLTTAIRENRWEKPCKPRERWENRKCREFCEVREQCPFRKDFAGQPQQEEQADPEGEQQ